MKKFMLLSISFVVIGVVLFLAAFAPASEITVAPETAVSDSAVVTVVDTRSANVENNKILESRFLNMLNRNFVYNDSYFTVEDVVNDSMIALLDMRDSEDDAYISQEIVSDFVYDMYGIEVDYSEINSQFPKKEGYVFLLPRGYELYEHTVLNITENEDGTYTVKTNVKISCHDGTVYNDVCETLFVPNEASQFGYNIVHSNIGAVATAI